MAAAKGLFRFTGGDQEQADRLVVHFLKRLRPSRVNH